MINIIYKLYDQYHIDNMINKWAESKHFHRRRRTGKVKIKKYAYELQSFVLYALKFLLKSGVYTSPRIPENLGGRDPWDSRYTGIGTRILVLFPGLRLRLNLENLASGIGSWIL